MIQTPRDNRQEQRVAHRESGASSVVEAEAEEVQRSEALSDNGRQRRRAAQASRGKDHW